MSKVINDPIHGLICMPQYCLDIIDTPQFQRLRDLLQLGTTYFVFPGASHHRFEHCLGVSHLAGLMGERFKALQPELEISDHDLQLLRVAALCHDLGHGPFSHVFQSWANHHAKIPPGSWDHEEMSCVLLDDLITKNSLDYSTEDVKFIDNMIKGQSPPKEPLPSKEPRAWMFDIVHNSRNSVDVDKFDYLGRDAHMLGIKSSYDCSRLITYSRVINNEVCYHAKEVYSIYEMFHTRYTLFKRVYSHRVGKAIDYMISDVLTLADPYLHISEALFDPTRFTGLTDCILRDIEFSVNPDLKPARDIICNLRKRNLYRMAVEAIVPTRAAQETSNLTEEALSLCAPSDSPLSSRDIIIQNLHLNYSMNSVNPVDNVHFFSSFDANESFSINRAAVSLLLPDTFEERALRIYCRDPAKVPAALKAFENWRVANHVDLSIIPTHGPQSSSPPTTTTTQTTTNLTTTTPTGVCVTPPRKPKSARRLFSPFPDSPNPNSLPSNLNSTP
ncbi:Deoxynucleoside triphosphate triphosphohydrolase SAMHD1 [Pelomyxa schiedti]|nr:Deoxynucleoside triphosphate triphosphohydrolase SAMHD1 [Pelomyxa schiedti]